MDEVINDKKSFDLSRELDRGIDDMEAGREFSLDDAFDKIDKLLDNRKVARA